MKLLKGKYRKRKKIHDLRPKILESFRDGEDDKNYSILHLFTYQTVIHRLHIMFQKMYQVYRSK